LPSFIHARAGYRRNYGAPGVDVVACDTVSFPPPDYRPAPDREVQDLSSPETAIVVAIGDVAVGRLVIEALRAQSEHVILVSSAAEALKELSLHRPALLVVDDELPLVRGLDLAGRTRSERSDVEIILLTDDEDVCSLVGRLRVERIRCILKPFDIEKLRQAVGVASRALGAPGATYDDLVAELEDQRLRFERRIRNLERSHSSRPPPAPDLAATALTPTPPPDGPLPRDLHLLVVDDDPLVRRAMARKFSKHQVTLAENGLAATRELERSRPDIIVSDLRMPEMDGLALAEEVQRRWPELSERIVFVSAAGSHIERAGIEAPAHPVLKKPVDGLLLENRIAEILAQAIPPSKG
jgi:DNA-binding response OmpR family regulator